MIKQAVILAGGLGVRLRPLTYDVPKPMVLVNGKPFLEHLLELLKANGITEVVLLLGYLADKVLEYFGDGSEFGINIRYSIGKVSDSTGTRIKYAEPLLDNTFLLMYGDNYCPLDIDRLWGFHTIHNVLVTTTVYVNKDWKGEYGAENNVFVDNGGYVREYDKTRKSKLLNGVDIGFFLVEKKVLSLMPDSDFSFEEKILPMLLARNQLAGYQTEHRYYYISNADSLKQAEEFLKPQRVIFLDRDGVINRDPPYDDYVKSWDEFVFTDGAIEALRLLGVKGYNIYIVTNQRGIARGVMSDNELSMIHAEMLCELRVNGIDIKQIYYCPHDIEDNCDCRKPKAGMLFKAASDHNIDLMRSYFIGDSDCDMEAGILAGCKFIRVTSSNNLLSVVKELVNDGKN